MTALDNALALAGQGIPSFPCLLSKAPACPGGFKTASADADCLRRLWRRYPGELLGVPTGHASGIDALDVDPGHGGEAWLNAHCDQLPGTRIHTTRSAGKHLLFRTKPGLRNSAGKIAPGIDVRAAGGFLIWWPAAGLSVPSCGPLAPWPDWLLKILLTQPAQLAVASTAPFLPGVDGRNRYLVAAVRRAVESVASAGRGCRNDTLNRETHNLARFIATGELRPADVAAAMAAAAQHVGLSEQETVATIASALRARGASA